VNFVSWGDSARFAKWMHNGQPSGVQNASTTEGGSYALNGATSYEALQAVTRNLASTWVIPSEDEWYKAAYHKNDGVTGNYFDYPTSSNSDPNNDLDGGGNNATFSDAGGSTIGSPYWRTEVGAHVNSESPYGTFDQGGNLWEWNESRRALARGVRGGSARYKMSDLIADRPNVGNDPTDENYAIGFRVASVPEPATIALLAVVAVGMLVRRRVVRR